MKNYKNQIVKILMINIFLLFLLIVLNISYGYQIQIIAITKDELRTLGDVDINRWNFPEILYKKQVSAYSQTIKDYANRVYPVHEDTGWVYKEEMTGQSIKENDYYTDDTPHDNAYSFERYYEYLHKNQNSQYTEVYDATASREYRKTRYHDTGILYTQIRPEISYLSAKKVWNVWGESDNYSGIYGQPASHSKITGLRDSFDSNQDIMLFNSNLYRFAVVNGVYLSNNYLNKETVRKMYNVFKDVIKPGDTYMTLYQSSVLRTSSKNNKGDNYYNNMDTAFKFWETTIRGSALARDSWEDSPSTLGKRDGKIQSSSSVINYYDNTFQLPIQDKLGKTVYVRHIDVTNLENINTSTITNDRVISLTNEQAIENKSSDWEVLNKYVYPSERDVWYGQEKYTDKYALFSNDTVWRFGNIKYSYSNEEKGQYFSSLNRGESGNDDNLSAVEKNILNNYNCIGAIIGKGETLELAAEKRNSTINNVNLRNQNSNYTDSTGGIVAGNDWASTIVTSGETTPVIVIDFYYEKKPTEVYVRHIDVTNKDNIGYIYPSDSNAAFLQTNAGQAFRLSSADWNISTGRVGTTGKNIQPNLSGYIYQEVYEKKSGAGALRIANIKYDHETAGSYWNLLSTSQKSTYNNYTCIGSAVGKGDRVDLAEVKRDEATLNVIGNNKINFVNYSQGSVAQSADSYINKNGNYTSEVIGDNDYRTVVVDFYYVKDVCQGDSCIDDDPGYKRVYVRHIDVTGIDDKINAVNIDTAVRNGKVLSGKGKAKKNDWNEISKDGGNYPGYQEKYTIKSNESLEVFRDPNDNYNCIGSNMTMTDDSNIDTAKSRMNTKLNGYTSKYDSWLKESRKTTASDNSDVVIMDFYYTSKHSGTPIKRNKVGRLAFYTTGQSDKFSSKVNNHTNNDSGTVYDVIPSNEVLRMSVDNAYTYMLGAINIKEQTMQGTYTFDYTLKQPYEVEYTYWISACDSCGTKYYDQKRTASCTHRVYSHTTCSTSESGVTTCKDHYKPCGSTSYSYSDSYQKVLEGNSVSRTYRYQIPYKYTYYKVKNLRLYSISKIELNDGYNNKGLPLFDGKTHTVQTTDKYKSGFNDSTFTISSNNQSNNGNSEKTLSKTLYYVYDNENTVAESVLKNYASGKINSLFDGIRHTDAAQIEKFNDINSSKYTSTSNHLTATLYVKNDEISFMDKIKNSRIYLIGQNVSSLNTLNGMYARSEKDATRKIDLVSYTASKTTNNSRGTYTYSVSEADRVNVETVYPKSTKNKYLPSDSKTNSGSYGGRDYYNLENLSIPESRLNGKRYSYGKIYYTLLSGNDVLNFDVDDNKVVNGNHDWNSDKSKNRKSVSGATGNTFIDTEMYNTKGTSNPLKTTLISPGTLSDVIWEYGKNNGTDADIVDVFTPISFTTKIVGNSNNDIRVDHTVVNNNNNKQKQIQKNSRFTIQIDATNNNSTYSGVQTSKYLGKYYIKFNFDVQDIKISDAMGTNRTYSSNSASSNIWIGPIYNRYNGNSIGTVTVSAYALADPNEASGVVNQEQNEYEVRAVAINSPSTLDYDVLRGRISETTTFITAIQNTFSGIEDNNQYHQKYYAQKNIYGQSNYVANDVIETENISRVYDFKITDVKDVDWKNIFRTSTSTTTNVHSGKAYYSGVKKWNIYTTAYNNMITRDVSEIGATKQQILPVGPYKHTTSTYTKAPKLGYKVSFDLKTTGANANKKIVIQPSFYYIKKDATGYTEDIKLYYKNSSNKYVDISNYKLYFVPDDGYRLTFEGTDQSYRFSSSSISKTTMSLGSTKEITLTSKMMEQADNNFVQIWYGEYKLPNSTIVIGKGTDGKYNINRNRLTGGYIGIKFDIKVYEYKSSAMTETNISKVLSYSQNDKNASSNTNTSQWDYEGFLGFSNPGSSANNIKISLEKGVWTLNDTMYNKIKGTVLLYDTDATASSDYE